MLLIKKAQRQPSYFDGMEIGDELPIIHRDNISVKFEKSSNESGMLHVDVQGKIKRDFEIEYDFENFPTLREQFIKKIRFLFLRDFSIADFQNEDLKDTKLSLIKNLDLGYGLKIVKTNIEEIGNISREMKKMEGIPDDDSSPQLPKETLKDFVYTIYMEKNGKNVPLGFFAVPFNLADEIYDLSNLDEIRDFFIDLTETSLGRPIGEFAKELQAKHNITDVAGAFERLDSGHLSDKDILDFYNDQSMELKPDSIEAKQLRQRVENLIRKLHQGDFVTREDLKMSFTRPSVTRNVEYVKDYRRTIQLAQLEKSINKIEAMFEQRLKIENNEKNINDIRKHYFDMKKKISDQKAAMEGVKDITKQINDINSILENAADFIKK